MRPAVSYLLLTRPVAIDVQPAVHLGDGVGVDGVPVGLLVGGAEVINGVFEVVSDDAVGGDILRGADAVVAHGDVLFDPVPT